MRCESGCDLRCTYSKLVTAPVKSKPSFLNDALIFLGFRIIDLNTTCSSSGCVNRILRCAGVVLLASLLVSCAQGSRDLYVGKGMFGDIIVYENAQGLRTLEFERGGGQHTAVKPGDPAHLEFEYTRIALIALALARHPPERILVVGLGGGALPQFLRFAYPQARIDVAEIDPAVVRVAERYFGLQQDAQLRVQVGDGRAFIEKAAAGSYDIIILDAYGAGSQAPPHLITQEFLRAVRTALRPDGVAVSNLWGPNLNPQYHDMLSTHRAVFDGLYLVYAPTNVNVMVFGLPRTADLTQAQLAARVRVLGPPSVFRYDLGAFVEKAWLDADAVTTRGRVLRDPPVR